MPDAEETRVSRLIQPPSDFPVVWARPEDEQLYWHRDRTHFPDCFPPLEADFWIRIWEGMNRVEGEEKPNRSRLQCLNGYLYLTQEPRVPPEEAEALKKQDEDRVEADLGKMDGLWGGEWLPEIRPHLDFWAAFDLEAAQVGNLVAHLEETLERLGMLWHLHFQIVGRAYIDFAGSYRVRQVVMAFGRRYTGAGAIEKPEDVFYLTFEELLKTRASLTETDYRDRVAKRRSEQARFQRIGAPSELGTQKEPEEEKEKPKPVDEPGLLRGNSGAPGKVQAAARVIRSFEDGHLLGPGEVLVTETTAPSWTPLFAKVAAVVTETGGILSHCAVVAREYRIPPVVGVDTALSQIEDGQILEVDGDARTVRLVEIEK